MPAAWALAGAVLALLGGWLAAVRSVRGTGRPGLPALLLTSCAPPLLVTLTLLGAAARFGDLRAALEGLRVHLGGGPAGGGTAVAGLPELRIGGSPASDHLVVRGLPAGFLRLRAAPGGVRVELAPAPGGQAAAAAQGGAIPPTSGAAVRVDGHLPFHNAVALSAGDRIVVPGSAALVFDANRRALGPAAAGYPAIPSRSNLVLGLRLPIGRELAPEQAVYPLADYGAPLAEAGLAGAAGEPLGSFICRAGWLRRDLYLVIADPGVRVEREGQPPVALAATVATLGEGGSVHLSLFRIDREGRGGGGGRAQERRSFSLHYRGGVLDLVLDTPLSVRLRQDVLAELRRRAERAGVPMLLATLPTGAPGMAAGAASPGRMVLTLGPLGAPLASELFSRIELAGGSELRVTTHTGSRRFRLGEAFPVGQEAAALVRISRLDLPWGTLVLVWLLAAAACRGRLGLFRRLSGGQLVDLVLLSGVETLLALRLLIAYQAAFLAPEAAPSVWLSLAALAIVPFIIAAALSLYRERRLDAALVLHGAVATAALAAVVTAVPGGPFSWLSLLLPALAAALLGLLLLPALDRLSLGAPGVQGGSGGGAASYRSALGLAGLLVLARLGSLLAFGWKERLDLPGLAVAASIYYTPCALLVCALLWGLRGQWRTVGALWLVLAVLYLGVPVAVHDAGSALIFPLPVMLLFALPLLERRGVRQLLLAAPLAAVLLVHVLLPLVPSLGLSPRLAGWSAADAARARDDAAAAEALLGRKARTDQNALRVWSLVAPEELRQVGTTEAEGLQVVMEDLRDYAARGPFGAGFLRVPLAPALAATQLDDNVTAVHLLGPFGWVGGLALCLLLAGWALAPLVSLAPGGPPVPREPGPRFVFGLLLVWTLSLAGLYMISANVGLLLFTGKNAYFLAAASRSDLVEGTLLVTLALWAWSGPLRRSGGTTDRALREGEP